MNNYDSTKLSDLLLREGYCSTESIDQAEVIILNTCNIREKAAEKIYSELGKIGVLKIERNKAGKQTRVVVAGCVAQAEGEELLKRSSVVDILLGSQSYHKLVDLLKQPQKRYMNLDFLVREKFSLSRIRRKRPISSFLTIQEGCDKFCTFCVVPYTRGAEVSRPVEEIYREACELVEDGSRELILIGQNVNSYHGLDIKGNPTRLAALFEKLSEIPGLLRIRYTTSHPNDMSEDLLLAHRDNPKLMPYLHLPIQSGSDRILKKMNRNYTVDTYRRIIDRVRNYCPDIALSSDFIVGFPGETEAEFNQTLSIVEQLRFTHSYAFLYSPRPGTPAAEHAVIDPKPVLDERLHRLQALLQRQSYSWQKSFVGRTTQVLLEKKGKYEGQLVGRSPEYLAVHVAAGEYALGELVTVKLTDTGTHTLSGELFESAREQVA